MEKNKPAGVILERYAFPDQEHLRARVTILEQDGNRMPVSSPSEWWEPRGSGSYAEQRDTAIKLARQLGVTYTQINEDLLGQVSQRKKIENPSPTRTEALIGFIGGLSRRFGINMGSATEHS